MAKYQATPFYEVQISEDKSIRFDFFGVYETTDTEEVAALNALVPAYIQCVDNGGIETKANETKPEETVKPARKTSGK
jgi:hypothetical protein